MRTKHCNMSQPASVSLLFHMYATVTLSANHNQAVDVQLNFTMANLEEEDNAMINFPAHNNLRLFRYAKHASGFQYLQIETLEYNNEI